jgi:SAM-dependent methyltransferase
VSGRKPRREHSPTTRGLRKQRPHTPPASPPATTGRARQRPHTPSASLPATTGHARNRPHTPPASLPPAPGVGPLSEELVDDLVDAGSREHYADAALYDYEYRRRRADVTFYRELARTRGGPILELGAGSGRITIPLARDGHEVVALDRAAEMLDRLRGRVAALPAAARPRVTVLEADLCTFDIPRAHGKFPLAIAAFNVLEHLYTRGEVEACLHAVARHLAPGGVLAFDVQLPDLAWLLRDPSKRWAKTRFTDPTTKRAMYYSTSHDYDPIGQIANIRLYYDPVDGGRGRVVKLSQRKFFPAELEALIAHAGFRVVERYGDFAWRPLDGTAESQVLVCEPNPRRR